MFHAWSLIFLRVGMMFGTGDTLASTMFLFFDSPGYHSGTVGQLFRPYLMQPFC